MLDRLRSIQGALAPVSLASKEGIEHDIALATQPATVWYGPTVVITSTSLLERLAPQCRLTFKAMITRFGQVVASAKPGGGGNFAASHGTVRSKDRYCQEHARRWALVARPSSSSARVNQDSGTRPSFYAKPASHRKRASPRPATPSPPPLLPTLGVPVVAVVAAETLLTIDFR